MMIRSILDKMTSSFFFVQAPPGFCYKHRNVQLWNRRKIIVRKDISRDLRNIHDRGSIISLLLSQNCSCLISLSEELIPKSIHQSQN